MVKQILPFIILIFFLSTFSYQYFIKDYALISPINFNTFFINHDLDSIIQKNLYQTKGNYGIYIKNLKSGESYSYKSSDNFKPGSLYKLKLMVLVFEKIKNGELKEDQILQANIKDLNKMFGIDEETAELTSGTIKQTVKTALEQMITISHNYSAFLLTKELGVKNLSVDITAKEIGNFYQDLYEGKVIDPEYSKKMLDLLIRQKLNDRLPKYLPKEVNIAHKTAEIDYHKHDGGIIFSPKGDYILIVLTKSDFPMAAAEKTATISKQVFEYFDK